MTETRIKCNRCDAMLHESKFHSDGMGGRRRQCVFCMREINRAWRAANREHVAAYNRARPKRKARK